jgi:hypothetical protein
LKIRGRWLLSLIAVTTPLGHASAKAQFTLDDLVVTAGASAEGYRGNLPAVGVPVQDSTEFATAAIGEVSLRAVAANRSVGAGSLQVSFDGGLRQFSARGFELRDYSPREWVGLLDARYVMPLGSRVGLLLSVQARGRQIDDRPPMPLFLQPGYRAGQLAVGANIRGPRDVLYDFELSAERSDFLAPRFAPQIRLLNQNVYRAEAGATMSDGVSVLRVFLAGVRSGFPRQITFDPTDPERRDVTLHGGGSWTYEGESIIRVGLEGRANRSNSNRPEYDALTLSALISASLPQDVSFSAYGALTAKQYLHDSRFARLLPGDEANNASLAYVSFTRPLARNLDGTVRVGWTRAETEIGSAYFERFGGSFLLHFRPGG